MNIQELEEETFTYLRKEPIHIGGQTVGLVNLTLGKAGLIAKGIIDILKKAAGESYEPGDREEIALFDNVDFEELKRSAKYLNISIKEALHQAIEKLRED